MATIILELTEKEAKIYDEAMKKADETAVFLAGLSHADRLDWLKKRQYPRPISFEREIGYRWRTSPKWPFDSGCCRRYPLSRRHGTVWRITL